MWPKKDAVAQRNNLHRLLITNYRDEIAYLTHVYFFLKFSDVISRFLSSILGRLFSVDLIKPVSYVRPYVRPFVQKKFL